MDEATRKKAKKMIEDFSAAWNSKPSLLRQTSGKHKHVRQKHRLVRKPRPCHKVRDAFASRQ